MIFFSEQNDDMASPVEDDEFSEWTIPNTSHMDITGDEAFCRISIGAFMNRRTEALGSLSGDVDDRVSLFILSIGAFMSRRTEALGSLSGDVDDRVSCGHLFIFSSKRCG